MLHGAQTTAQSAPRLHGLQSCVHRADERQTLTVVGTPTAPGPGRPAVESKRALPDEGTQNVPARVVSKRLMPPPSGTPCSTMVPAGPPNAPSVFWPGQNLPFPSAVIVESAVVRPERLTLSVP